MITAEKPVKSIGHRAWRRGQKSEDRGQRTEDRGQRA